jgi:hypothetical protein
VPVAAPQSCTVSSPNADASSLELGEKATDMTEPLSPSSRVPEPYHLIP